MKKYYTLLLMLLWACMARAADVGFGGLLLRSAGFTGSGPTYQSPDSTYIGYDSATFKPLLLLTGRISVDPTQYPYVQAGLGTGYRIYGRTVNGTYLLLDSGAVSNTWTNLNIGGLLDSVNGMTLSSYAVASVTVAGVPLRPAKLWFTAAPPQSGPNNSVLALQGKLLLPVDNGTSFTTPINQLLLTDTGQYLRSFTSTAVSGGVFRLNGMMLRPLAGMVLRYDSSAQQFSLYGNMRGYISDDSLPVPDSLNLTMGDTLSPGMVISGGTFSRVYARVTDNFKLKALTLRADTLALHYNPGAGRYETYGQARFLVGSDTIPARLGDSITPGLVITGGTLTSLSSSITRVFSLKKLRLAPDTFTFGYVPAQRRYTMYGRHTLIVGSDSMPALLGSVQQPGLQITNGDLTYFSASLVKNMRIRNLRIDPDTLTFVYQPQLQQFSMYGGLTLLYGSDSLAAVLGNAAQPGYVTSNDTVRLFEATITGNIRIRKLAIDPDTLTFSYRQSTDSYQGYGRLNVLVGADTIHTTLGTAASPGMMVQGDSLVYFRAGIVRSFTIDSTRIIPDTLTFVYRADSDAYNAYGNIHMVVRKDTLGLQLGTATQPGLVITNGDLSYVGATLTGNFAFDKLNLYSDSLQVAYNRSADQFEAYGGVAVLVKNDTLDALLGNAQSPGLQINNGSLSTLTLGVNTAFSIKGLHVVPDSLTLNYRGDSSQYDFYGSMQVRIKQDTVNAWLGNAANPGALIQNGDLVKLASAITGSVGIDSSRLVTKDTLTMVYRGDSGTFALYGNVALEMKQDTLAALLGTAANPGLWIANSEISSLNLGINGPFKLRGLRFITDTLQVNYVRDSSLFTAYGRVAILAKNDTIRTLWGNATQPGLVLNNGSLQALNASVSGKFMIDSTTFRADSLAFLYNRTNDQYGMYGGFTVWHDQDSLSARLGTQSQPGLLFANGSIQQFNAGITGKFTILSLNMLPKGLTFTYNRDSATFGLYGNLAAFVQRDTLRHDSLYLWLGNASTPGVLIKNGHLSQLNAAITDSFNLKGAAIKPINLGLSLNLSQSLYSFFGTLQVIVVKDSLHRDSFQVAMGTQQAPGMVIGGGKVIGVNASVTANFKLRGLDIAPKNLTFTYDTASAEFTMYGDLTLSYGGEYMYTRLGAPNPNGTTWTPGLVINTNGGGFRSLFFTTTDTFRIKKLLIAPQNLSIVYDRDSDYFELYGGGTLKLNSDSITLNMGTAAAPGLVIDSGQVEQINLGVTANFKIGGFEMKPVGLTFDYNRGQDQWEMYGDLTFVLSKDTITALMGNAAAPGMVVQNGTLQQLNIAVNSDIKLGNLSVKTDSLGVKYMRNTLPSGAVTQTYYLHGGVSFSELWNASAVLSTPQNPYGLEISIDSLGNKEVEVDGLVVELDQAQIGGITIKQLIASINKVAPGDYDIDASCTVVFPAGFQVSGELAFEDNNGTFELDYISVDYQALGDNQGIELGGGVAITELGGSLAYNRVTPPCTTSYVTYDSAFFVNNIRFVTVVNKPVTTCPPEQDNFVVTAKVALDVGGQLNLLGTEVQMVRSVGNVTITNNYLDINDTVVMGAYNPGNGWRGLVTAGFADVNINWSTGVYSVNGNLNYPPAVPLVNINAGMLYKSTGLIDAELQLGLILPPWVPIIGGDQYASVNGLMRYAKYDPYNSYAGGWVTYPHPSVCWADWWPHPPYPCFYTAEAGAAYNFGSGNVNLLGSGDVSNMQNQLTNDGFNKTATAYQHVIAATKFELDGNSSSAIVKIIPSQKLDLYTRLQDSVIERVQVAIVGPLGTQSNLSFYYRKDNQSQPDITDNLIALDSIYTDSVAYLTTLISANGNTEGETLPPGEYTVILTLDSNMVQDGFGIQAQASQFYPKPQTQIQVKNTSNTIAAGGTLDMEMINTLNVTGDTLKPRLFVYYDDDSTGYDGHLFASYAVNPNENTLVSLAPYADSVVVRYDTVVVNGQKRIQKTRKALFAPDRTIYVYTKLEDGVNIPVKSAYTGAYRFVSQPSPKVLVTGGRPYQLNTPGDSLHLNVQFNFGQRKASDFWVTLYYDLDSLGNTGMPVPGVKQLRADLFNASGYWFTPDLRKVKGIERVFFYAVVTDSTTGHLYKSYNSYPYLFGNNVQVKCVYADSKRTPAKGISVGIDANGNQRIDHHEYTHKSNKHGVVMLNVSSGSQVELVAALPTALKGYTPAAALAVKQSIDVASTNQVTMVVNYPGIQGRVTDTLNRGVNGVRVYADLNNNGQYDAGQESAVLTDAQGRYVLMNVFGAQVNIRTVLTGTPYGQGLASAQPLHFDDRQFHEINFTLK